MVFARPVGEVGTARVASQGDLRDRASLEQRDHRVIDDVALTLRNYKRLGWMLDNEGRATGDVVPIWPHARRLGEGARGSCDLAFWPRSGGAPVVR